MASKGSELNTFDLPAPDTILAILKTNQKPEFLKEVHEDGTEASIKRIEVDYIAFVPYTHRSHVASD